MEGGGLTLTELVQMYREKMFIVTMTQAGGLIAAIVCEFIYVIILATVETHMLPLIAVGFGFVIFILPFGVFASIGAKYGMEVRAVRGLFWTRVRDFTTELQTNVTDNLFAARNQLNEQGDIKNILACLKEAQHFSDRQGYVELSPPIASIIEKLSSVKALDATLVTTISEQVGYIIDRQAHLEQQRLLNVYMLWLSDTTVVRPLQ